MDKWNLIRMLAVAGMGVLAFLTIVRNEIRLKDQRIGDRLEEARKQRDKRAQDEQEQQDDDEEPISIHPEW